MNKGYCFWLHNAFLRKLHCKKGSTIYQIDYRSVSKIACVNLLFTLDLTCPARFLWLWPGTLRSQKWYDRIAFQNALLLMWIGSSAHCFWNEISLWLSWSQGLVSFVKQTQICSISIWYGVNSSAPEQICPVWFSRVLFTLHQIGYPNRTENQSGRLWT